MHVVLPKRSSGEWRLRQNDSQTREHLAHSIQVGELLRVEVSFFDDSLIERRPGHTQRQRQLVRLKKEPVHSAA